MEQTDIDKNIAEVRKALLCLYLEVTESVAVDVKAKVEALINQLKACREECKARNDLLIAYRTGSHKKVDSAFNRLDKLKGGYSGQTLNDQMKRTSL